MSHHSPYVEDRNGPFVSQEGWGNYSVKFRHEGRSFKRSLETNDRDLAEDRLLGIQRFLHRLATGREQMPRGIEPGAYIVSEGTVRTPIEEPAESPTLRQVSKAYLASRLGRWSDGYIACQRTHLNNLCKFLKERADQPCSEISAADLENFLQYRLTKQHRNTVIRERSTLLSFGKWLFSERIVAANPAAKLATIKGGPNS